MASREEQTTPLFMVRGGRGRWCRTRLLNNFHVL
ncbi:hypothetical protein E2C01_100820 [Portunus trituberculatus]|uniref:Uncharacterized protein n=1 Tax=Portunus trituberculatus TaxID=210409 RepID=A0A5B7KKG9_PORTR|nr:hypothetical protein [Portunus trituberculatus]